MDASHTTDMTRSRRKRSSGVASPTSLSHTDHPGGARSASASPGSSVAQLLSVRKRPEASYPADAASFNAASTDGEYCWLHESFPTMRVSSAAPLGGLHLA